MSKKAIKNQIKICRKKFKFENFDNWFEFRIKINIFIIPSTI